MRYPHDPVNGSFEARGINILRATIVHATTISADTSQERGPGAQPGDVPVRNGRAAVLVEECSIGQ